MTAANASHNDPRYVIVCADDEPEVLAALVRDVENICQGALEVEACADADEVIERIASLQDAGAFVPLIITDHMMPGTTGVDLLIALHEDERNRSMGKVLLSGQTSLEAVTKALNRGALHRHLAKPWDYDVLRQCVRDLLTLYLLENAPAQAHRFVDLINMSQVTHAYQSQRETLVALDSQLRAVQRSFLTDVEMSDDEAERAMIEALDEALGNPPRKQVPAGSILFEEGQTLDGIAILESGQVELCRTVEEREISFHSESVGKIIGLLALAQARKAFFTCRALTDVTVIPLSLRDLNFALQKNPVLSIHFVTVLVRTMATRNRRVADLIASVEHLNADLATERDNLTAALAQLEKAQMRLVESEKLATLGQLSAGVAHELNNPVAAMQRAVDFIAEDIMALVSTRPHGEALQVVTLSALTSSPMSTRQARILQSALTAELDDRRLARRLITVGITTAEQYRARFAGIDPNEVEQFLGLMERYHQLGTSLRNISRCGDHIAAIVKSLRSYARTDQSRVVDVNIHEGLDDTLLMFNYALRGIEVVRRYGEIPTIECHASEINQVWTNLISNAQQAMGGEGTLRVQTDAPDPDHVRVRITDTGTGIAPDLLERVFDTNFTTKNGEAHFGLGLGLAICRQIVNRHGGTITVESKPGRTTFTTTLPVRYSRILGEGRAS